LLLCIQAYNLKNAEHNRIRADRPAGMRSTEAVEKIAKQLAEKTGREQFAPKVRLN